MINRKIDVWPCLLLTFQRLISTSKNYSGALLFFLFLQRAYLWAFHFSNFSTWNRPGSQKQWRSLYHEFSQKQISKAVYNFWIHSTAVKWIWVFYYNFFVYVYVMVFLKKMTLATASGHCQNIVKWRKYEGQYQPGILNAMKLIGFYMIWIILVCYTLVLRNTYVFQWLVQCVYLTLYKS